MLFAKILIVCWLILIMRGDLVCGAEGRNTLQIVAQIQPRASLSLTRTQITFAEPEDQRLIPSLEGPVQLTVKVRASAIKSATLNMLAESDLEGLAGSIPIQQVEWTARGSGTAHGVLSRTNEQMVERYITSGIHQTQLLFALKNNGNLPPGTYLTFVNFTFTSP
jgi:hypothetical protein